MNYEIRLSGDDALTIISLLENAGNDSLAVKVRDQMYEQRQMRKKDHFKEEGYDGWAKRDGWNGSLKREGWDW